jgi:hypothetical protein
VAVSSLRTQTDSLIALSNSGSDSDGQNRNLTEVVIKALRFLGPKNGNGAKPAESQRAESTDEADNPFNGAAREDTDMDVPF